MKTLPILRLAGRSGCRLEVFAAEGTYTVRKYSKDKSYNPRLLLQAAKQQVFQSGYSIFKTPIVLATSPSDVDETWFDMEYVHGQKYSEYLERLSIAEVKLLTDRFYNYFIEGLEASKRVVPDHDLFLNKVQSLELALRGREGLADQLVQTLIAYLKNIPDAEIPIGNCHGDFTFSNMLFSEDGIYLVDFLDSFIDSPLIDLVKFRQDTFFYWTLFIDQDFPPGRSGKIVQIFTYLDNEIFRRLALLPDVKAWYTYLQVFNLVRILPYVTKQREIDFVQNSILKLINITP